MTKVKWIIDAGHAPNTPGKRSPVLPKGEPDFGETGLAETEFRIFYEWQFNLSVAMWIDAFGKDNDLDVFLPWYVGAWRDVPIPERRAEINRICSDAPYNCRLISIHANAAPEPGWSKAHGAVAFMHPRNAGKASQFLAAQLLGQMASHTPISTSRGIRQAALGICNVRCPAVLFEAGFSLISAALTLIIGMWLINRFVKGTYNYMVRRDLDATLRPFLRDILNFGLKALLFIAVIGMVGVQMSSFIAVLGGAALAVGLALQGSLSNFAGGVIVLILKPYKVGEFIETGSIMGTVQEIQIFYTVLLTPDNKTITLPNGSMANTSIINYSRQGTRRLDMKFGVAYGTDAEKVKTILLEIANSDERVIKDKDVLVRMVEMADSSVNFNFRVWVNVSDYWPLYYDFNEKVYATFNEEGIGIPFPQMDVHLHKEK
jgi:small conductance mechanosensitive channel